MQSRETLLPPCDAVPAQAGSKGARCCKDAMHTEPRSNHEAAPSAHLCRPVPRGPAPDSPRADTATECQALLLARRCSEAAHPLPLHRGCGIKFACIVPGHRRVCAPFPTAHILASATRLGTGRGTRNGTCTSAGGCPWRGPQPVPARLARAVSTWHAHTRPFTLLVHGPDVQVWAGPAGRPAWARPALSCRMLGRRDQLDRDVSCGPLRARACTLGQELCASAAGWAWLTPPCTLPVCPTCCRFSQVLGTLGHGEHPLVLLLQGETGRAPGQ